MKGSPKTQKNSAASGTHKRLGGQGLVFGIPNREDGTFQAPKDGWIQLAKKGEWYHPKYELIQVIDDAACDAIMASFEKLKQQPNFCGLLIDRDHFSMDPDCATEAFGWIESLEKRDDGIWGLVRWSSLGLEQIEGGVYRLVSPVFSDLEWLEGPRARPGSIIRVALTNDPNMKGMAPVSNREVPLDVRMKLCRILGIEDSADDAALYSALEEWEKDQHKEDTMTPEETENMKRLQASVEQLNATVTSLTEENTTLKTTVAEARNRAVTVTMQEFKDVIGEKTEVWKNRITANVDDARDVLTELRAARAQAKTDRSIGDPKNRGVKPDHDENNGIKPENQDSSGDSAEQQARARKVGILAAEIVNRSQGRKTRAQAFREADALTPKVEAEAQREA